MTAPAAGSWAAPRAVALPADLPAGLPADLSVVICSLNGAPGVDRCLRALARQTVRSRLEIILVDDGSADGTADVGARHGAIVIRHEVNRGLGAARNSGLLAATAPVVAFVDDDCEPEPAWAQRLLAGYRAGVVGVGGGIVPSAPPGFMLGYLSRHNPLAPLELDLAESGRLAYRLGLYLRRQWAPPDPSVPRDVYSFVGANMSFRRPALLEVGGCEERFRLGGDDTDLCLRLRARYPAGRLTFVPGARVVHHFEPSLRDTLRRSRCYGQGSAALYRKWPGQRPTFFPAPLITAAVLAMSVRAPVLAVAALAVPHAFSPRGLRAAVAGRRAGLLDAYVQLAQETCADLGFLEGLWIFRRLVPEAEPGRGRSGRSRGPGAEPGQSRSRRPGARARARTP